MSTYRPSDRHPLVQRFAQACTISLATFVTSGAGLLAFVREEQRPAWLAALAILSAGLVVVSFTGWLVASLAVGHRGSVTGAGRS
jgi:hypothetical protein